MSDIQTNTGRRNGVMPGARSVATVTTRFTPVAMLPMLVTSSPSAQWSGPRSVTLDVEYCKILELAPGGETFRSWAVVGYAEEDASRTTFSAGRESQAGYTLLVGEPVICEDIRTERRFSVPPLLRRHGVVSTMSVAIPGQGRPFGVLQVDTARRRRFSRDDANFLQAVANVLATAIRRREYDERLAAGRAEADRLAQLERLRTEFISSVSHDLKTPLTAIGSGLGLLELSLPDRMTGEERRLLANARRNADRLRVLIDGLLAYNALEAGTLRLARWPLDLRAVASEAAGAVRLLTEGKGQSLELDVPEPLPVEGDAFRLGQVLINLLGNAHEHTPPGTHIVVSGEAGTSEVVLSVSDHGPGIPAEQLETIFERDRRLDTAPGGWGLGLAIARGIVALHGGRIWAQSEPGRGATFCVALPRRPVEGDREDPGR